MKKKNLFGLLLSVAMLASCNSKNFESSSQPSSVTSSSSTSVESSSSSNSVESSSSSKVEEKVTVTFDADNGVLKGPASLSIKKGEKIDQSQIPTASKDKHAFRFWAKRGETTAFDFYSVITDNLELIAIYQADTFTITYEGLKDSETHNNRTSYSSYTPTFTLQAPVFNREGYEFDSWLDEEGRPISSVIQGSTGNRRFTASFKAINYSITYQGLEDATTTNRTSYNVETETFTLYNPTTREGYTFTGWEDRGLKVTTINKGTTGNIVLKATWSANAYSITYEMPNDIDGIYVDDWDSRTLFYTKDDEIILPTVSATDLTFKGWRVVTDGTTAGEDYLGTVAAGTFNSNLVLAPHFVVTVTFETTDQWLHINNVLGTPEGVNYLEFEIGEKLENLPMGGGEDVFAEMYYIDEEGEPVDIIDTYQDFVVTKNITLWVRDGSSAGIV